MTILLSPFFQVTPGSKAAIANLCIGDVITAIDGENTSNMTHLEAQNKIKGCTDNMTLTVARWGPWKCSLISGWLEAARGQTCLPDFRIPCWNQCYIYCRQAAGSGSGNFSLLIFLSDVHSASHSVGSFPSDIWIFTWSNTTDQNLEEVKSVTTVTYCQV